jgi:hypothetical protein
VLDRRSQYVEFLPVFQGTVLAYCAKDDHAVNTRFDHDIEVTHGGGQIERLIVLELRCGSRINAPPVDWHDDSFLSFVRAATRLDHTFRIDRVIIQFKPTGERYENYSREKN